MKKIIIQKIGKVDNINLSNGSNAKILFPLLLLSFVLVFSFAVNDVSAANGTSTNTICQTNTVSSSITGKTTDSQSTVQSASETIKKTSVTNKITTTSNSKSLNNNKNQKLQDVVPVTRGGNSVVSTSNSLNYTMGITVTASDSSPDVGKQYHYTIIVTNNGPDNATHVQVRDGIPKGMKFNGFSASQGTYNYPTEKWNVGSLANGASAILELFVTPTNSVAGTIVTNNVTIINTKETGNATVTIPGAPVPNVSLTLTASNLIPKVGQQFSYTIIATNNGPDLASNIQITNVIPKGLTFNSCTVTEGTYSTLPPIWRILTLASGASAIVQVFVTPTASLAGTTVTYTASNIIHTVTATIVVPKNITSNVSLTKIASNLAPKVGQKFNYIVIATNNGQNNASGVHITDKIPAGLIFNSYKATQGTYNHITGIWNVGTLANGANAFLQVFVTPTASLAGTTVTNTASSIGQIVTTTVVVPKNIVSNVTVSITASNLAPKVGQEFYYTITITNKGLDTVSAGIVKDILPVGLTFNSYTSKQLTFYNSVTGLWDVGSLVSGESEVLQLFVTPTASLAGTTVTNAATHSGQFVTATIVVPKNTVTNITLTQNASNLTPKVGQDFYYTITTTNNGPDTATGVQVLDKLPAGLTYKAYKATQGTYNSVTGIWNVGTLANGATATLYILVTPTSCTAGKSVTNRVKLTAQNEYNITKCPSATKTVNVKSQKHTKKYPNYSC